MTTELDATDGQGAETVAAARRRRRRGRGGRSSGGAGASAGVTPEDEPATGFGELDVPSPSSESESGDGSAVVSDGGETADGDASGVGTTRTRARRRRRAAARTRVEPAPGDELAENHPDGGDAGSVRAAAPGTAPDTAPDTGGSTSISARRPRPRASGVADRLPAQDRAPVESDSAAVVAGSRRATVAETGQAPAEPSTRVARSGGTRQSDRGRRRRQSGLTEEQKRVLREEGPERRMLVTEGDDRTQIAVLEGSQLAEHYVTRKSGRSMVGNVYLGRVQNVLPGMEAAFVDIGRGRNAVLYAGEVNYDEADLEGEAPRIENALKPGQPVLVQVSKDPIGSKGARLTAQISLAGRYVVLQPSLTTFGISRRLPDAERTRLRSILREVRPKESGVIVRTAAEGASAEDLQADLVRLQRRWEQIEAKAATAKAPEAIYAEPDLVVRVIRDIFAPDFYELVVDSAELHQTVRSYLEEVAPDLLVKLTHYEGALPIFEHYRVVEQIHKALERKVWLPSGGSIVIDRTEAMTVIDVNTGKFVGKSNLEATVFANNLEAADEIVRQLRLRDIGGIIIIDFIDMVFEKNQQAVLDRLRTALGRDKTKSQVMEISSLGLVQMTRKRVSGGLLDNFSEPCPTCEGRGVIITHEV